MFNSALNISQKLCAKRLRFGFSLVELLVVILVTTLVTGITFSVYRAASSHYLREDAYIQQQQNLRAATYLLSRDLRAAGNGISVVGPGIQRIQAYVPSQLQVLSSGVRSINVVDSWFRHPNAPVNEDGFMAIFGTDGGALGPDTLTIFKTEIEYPVSLGKVINQLDNKLTLNGPIREGTLSKDDILILIHDNEAVLLESDTEVISGTEKEIEYKHDANARFTSSSGPPAAFEVIGADVFNLRDISLVTYYIDETENRLMAAIHDQRHGTYDDPLTKSVVMANNIEDLQLYYFFDDDEINLTMTSLPPDISYGGFKNKEVKAVAIGLTSRSSYGDSKSAHYRPALFNRVAGTVPDNRRRSTIKELVTLRNFLQ
jgi:type II secretory pathway pseudopilin PulG